MQVMWTRYCRVSAGAWQAAATASRTLGMMVHREGDAWVTGASQGKERKRAEEKECVKGETTFNRSKRKTCYILRDLQDRICLPEQEE